jgi:hypothetical protein
LVLQPLLQPLQQELLSQPLQQELLSQLHSLQALRQFQADPLENSVLK